MNWQPVCELISDVTGTPFLLARSEATGGGCINGASRLLGSDGRRYFVKSNHAVRLDMFEAEAAALAEIGAAAAIRVPQVVGSLVVGRHACLVLEYIEFGHGGRVADQHLGEQLAQLHRYTAARHGWWRDNTIGSTPQKNHQTHDWCAFWCEHRLGFQLRMLEANGYGGVLAHGERLQQQLPALFAGYTPMPSLLHGDLWSGNAACTVDGTPVLFDPASYYGDRECDLAMTELFGGFSPDFYHAYRAAWPLDDGYRVRKVLYNLYHVLNHVNLFGVGYLDQARRMLAQLQAEIG